MSEKKRSLGLPTIRRIPMYYRLLLKLYEEGHSVVSSSFLAEALGLESIVVRKDLANIGIAGKPKIGFDTRESIQTIDTLMNSRDSNEAFLIGVGRLGEALLCYKGFEQLGLHIIAGFDIDPEKIGNRIQGKEVFDVKELPRLAQRMNIQIGVLCVAEEAAQHAADILVEAGIKGIWNFTPSKLNVPSHVVVQREDLAEGLAVLTVKLNQQKQALESPSGNNQHSLI